MFSSEFQFLGWNKLIKTSTETMTLHDAERQEHEIKKELYEFESKSLDLF